jgi:hypothetical protein
MLGSILAIKLLVAAMMLGAPVSAESAGGLKVWLDRVPQGEVLEFEGYVTAPAPMLVRYRLTILRISRGGRARTSQGGQVEISAPNQPTPLSFTAINVGSEDFYEVELVATGENGEEVRVELTRRPEEAQ